MQAPRGRQLKINGNIVNIPADVVNTVNMLPRFPNDTSTIKVNLKRRLQYKSSALSLNVRPNKVAEAAKWLVNNGNLYKDEGITFNDTWLEDNSNTQMLFDDSDNDQTSEGSENVVVCNAESLNVIQNVKPSNHQLVMMMNTGVKMRQKYLLESLTLC